MLLRHAIGGALRRIRLARGLTLRDLSQLSRVSIPYLSEIERGRKEPSSEILATICRVFGMTVLDLVDAVSEELRMPQASVLTLGSSVDGAAAAHPGSARLTGRGAGRSGMAPSGRGPSGMGLSGTGVSETTVLVAA